MQSETQSIEETEVEMFERVHQQAMAGENNGLFGRLWDLPFDHYKNSRAIGSHGLMEILRSPAHFYAKSRLGVDKDTPARRRGRLLHTAVLEPKRFRENFRVEPSAPKNTKAGKEEHAKFFSTLKPEHIVVQKEEADQIIDMINQLHRSRVAWNLIMHGQSELSGWWRDPSGYLCKYRPDKIIVDHGIIVDYKTAKDASFDGFRKAIANYKYALQAWWYLQGARATFDVPFQKFVFIAQEHEPPYAVQTFVANEAVFELGEKWAILAKRRYEQCLEREQAAIASGKPYVWQDIWHGYPDRAVDIDVPHWAFSMVEDEDVF